MNEDLLFTVAQHVKSFKLSDKRIYMLGAYAAKNISGIVMQSEQDKQREIQARMLLFLLIDYSETINSLVKFHSVAFTNNDELALQDIKTESDAYLLLIEGCRLIDNEIFKKNNINYPLLCRALIANCNAIICVLKNFYKIDFNKEFLTACENIKIAYRHRNELKEIFQ